MNVITVPARPSRRRSWQARLARQLRRLRWLPVCEVLAQYITRRKSR